LRTAENNIPSEATAALVRAMISATLKLGIQGIFGRLVVSELPDNLWNPDFEMKEGNSADVWVRARHLCPPGCPIKIKYCFTALKIEDVVSKRKSRPYAVSSARLVGNDIEVLLQPFS
jgi:hypothetical protein